MGAVTATKRGSALRSGAAAATWFGLVVLTAPACDEDECLAYTYAPPAALVTLRDVESGELLCTVGVVSTDRGETPHLFPDVCQYAVSTWYPTEDSGASIRLTVAGYEPIAITFDVERDSCGAVERPPVQEVELPLSTGASDAGNDSGSTNGDGGGPEGDAGGALEGGTLDGGAADGSALDSDRSDAATEGGGPVPAGDSG